MMTLTTRERGAGELRNGRPGERSAGLDNRALAELVLEAVRSVDEKKFHPPAPSSPGPGHGSRLLLAAVEVVSAGAPGAIARDIGEHAAQRVEDESNRGELSRQRASSCFPWRKCFHAVGGSRGRAGCGLVFPLGGGFARARDVHRPDGRE